jgi:uncharacterized protein
MTQDKSDLPLDKIREMCRRYKVKQLAIFGSAAKGTAGPDSDVDLLVEFQPDAQIGFLQFAKMQRELSSLLDRGVDLVPKGGLKPLIREEVLSTSEVLYAA